MSGAPVYWLLRYQRDVPPDDGWLTDGEARDQQRFRIRKRRDDWRLGRWTAHQALERAPTPARDARPSIVAAPDGAPEVHADGGKLSCVLSISHSHGVGLCAVAGEAMLIGCDVERVESRDPAFVADYFTSVEVGRVEKADRSERDLAATVIWSAKESALKALRQGLRLDTRSVSVEMDSLDPSEGWRPFRVAVPSGSGHFGGWWRTHEEFVLTVVAHPAFGVPVDLGLKRRQP